MIRISITKATSAHIFPLTRSRQPQHCHDSGHVTKEIIIIDDSQAYLLKVVNAKFSKAKMGDIGIIYFRCICNMVF